MLARTTSHAGRRRAPAAALAWLAVAAVSASASVQEAAPEAPPERPRLVVMVSIDQMIPEQLDRLEPFLTGGLGRFAREGRVHREARLRYSRTETGPGHASFGTGCNPSRHGVVANDFRHDEEGWIYCAADPDARPVTRFGREPDARSYHVSARNLLVPGAATWFERAFEGSRTVSIAGKDRSALLTAGADADVVLWWDKYRCGFTSSDRYGPELPAWARAWNDGWRERVDGVVWEPLVPLADLARVGTAPDDRPGEIACSSNGTTFPHPAPALSKTPNPIEVRAAAGFVYKSPLGDAFVVDLARVAVRDAQLGADEVPDLLCLSLSSCDTVGHLTGPYSAETTDTLLRADRALGALFDELDERVGAGRWIAVLSADHGVLELPEHRRANDEPGDRLAEGAIDAARDELRDGLEERFGDDFRASLGGGGLYLSAERLAGNDATPAEVRAFARDLVVDRNDWLAAGYTREELLAADAPTDDGFLRLARASTRADRGPDVALRVVPWTLIDRRSGTTHGTPYDYDRRVPLVFLGAPFEAGTRYDRAESIDALPTLLRAVGAAFDEDAFDGRAL